MWDFKHRAVLRCLADIIESEIGDRLPTLKGSTDKAIFISGTNGIKPPTPYVSLEFIPTIDDKSWVIDTGFVTVQVTDPDNPPATIPFTTLYYDTLVNFGIAIRIESDPNDANYDNTNAFGLMQDIRKCLILDKHRDKLKTDVFTVIHLANNRILSTPDLLSKQYHEVASMRLRCESVDRTINYDAGTFDHVSMTGELKHGDDDPSPIIINISTPPPTP